MLIRKNMFETDKNMLQAIDFLKESGEVLFKTTAYEIINISTDEQIRLFCQHFKINTNYIFGLDSKIYLK